MDVCLRVCGELHPCHGLSLAEVAWRLKWRVSVTTVYCCMTNLPLPSATAAPRKHAPLQHQRRCHIAPVTTSPAPCANAGERRSSETALAGNYGLLHVCTHNETQRSAPMSKSCWTAPPDFCGFSAAMRFVCKQKFGCLFPCFCSPCPRDSRKPCCSLRWAQGFYCFWNCFLTLTSCSSICPPYCSPLHFLAAFLHSFWSVNFVNYREWGVFAAASFRLSHHHKVPFNHRKFKIHPFLLRHNPKQITTIFVSIQSLFIMWEPQRLIVCFPCQLNSHLCFLRS